MLQFDCVWFLWHTLLMGLRIILFLGFFFSVPTRTSHVCETISAKSRNCVVLDGIWSETLLLTR